MECHLLPLRFWILAMEQRMKHILVVDDDIELALNYQELLQAHGYQASTAANGREALKLVMNSKVDAILCDLSMPELAGDLFYREVGRAHPRLLKRFVFLTANADSPLYETFLKSVTVPVITKPAPVERVLEKLAAVLADPPPGASPSSTSTQPWAAWK
jgi:two-component system, cell cycle sensor histidine kinase and response regulator CckA